MKVSSASTIPLSFLGLSAAGAPTLGRLGVVGLKGDDAKARDYYTRALAARATGVKERMAALGGEIAGTRAVCARS